MNEGLDGSLFLILLIVTISVGILAWMMLRTGRERLYCMLGIAGLYVWSGIGAARPDCADGYWVLYIVFLLVMVGAFVFVSSLFPVSPVVFGRVQSGIDSRERLWILLGGAYLLVQAFPLVYPKMRLDLLFHPPSPDVLSALMASLNTDTLSPPLIIRSYLMSLMFPCYLILLYVLRKHPFLQLAYIAASLYLDYVIQSYVARSTIVASLALFGMLRWHYGMMRKWKMVAIAVLCVLLALPLANNYVRIRQGVPIEDMAWRGTLESAEEVFEQETRFPRNSGIIMHERKQTSIDRYLLWVASLPLPKSLIGRDYSLMLNLEISTFVLGRGVTEEGGYVELAGMTLEGRYIFGEDLYWIHALMVGVLFGVLCKLTEGTPALLPASLFLGIAFLIASRTGMSGTWHIIINSFLLLYSWLAISVWTRERILPPASNG